MLARTGFVGRIGQAGAAGEMPFGIEVSDGVPLPQTEGTPNTITFTVSANGPVTSEITFTYQTVDGTAVAGLDYTKVNPTAGSLTSGAPTLDIVVSLLAEDGQYKPDRSFLMNISAASEQINRANGSGVITDSTAKPTISVGNGVPNPVQQQTGNTTQSFTITATTTPAVDILVDFTTRNGTATAGEDYGAKTGTATISQGTSSVAVDITILGGDTVVTQENYFLDISNARSTAIPDTYDITTATGTGNISQFVPAPAFTQPLYRLKFDEGTGNAVDSGTVEPGTEYALPANWVWGSDGDGTFVDTVDGLSLPMAFPPAAYYTSIKNGAAVYRLKYTQASAFCLAWGFTSGAQGFQIQGNNSVANQWASQHRNNEGQTAVISIPSSVAMNDGAVGTLVVRWGGGTFRPVYFIRDLQQQFATVQSIGSDGGTYSPTSHGGRLGSLQNGASDTLRYIGKFYGAAYYGGDVPLRDILQLEDFGIGTRPADEIIPAAAQTWFNKPATITDGTRTWTGGVSAGSAVEVTEIDNATGNVRTAFVLKDSIEQDDHNNAAFCLTSTGRILAGFQDHSLGNEMYFRTSTNPGDASAWDALRTEANFTSGGSYCQLHRLANEGTIGRIYCLYRNGTGASGNWAFRTSDDDGATWTAETIMIDYGVSTSNYIVSASNGTDRIWIGSNWSDPTQSQRNVHACILRAQALWQPDNTTSIAMPATGAALDLVFDSVTPDNHVWVWEASEVAGEQIVMYLKWPTGTTGQRQTNHELWYARRVSGSWTNNKIADVGGVIATSPPTPYGAGGCIDHNDANVVYYATNAGADTGPYNLVRAVTANKGVNWTPTTLVASSTPQIFRPTCPATRANAKPSTAEVIYHRSDGTSHGYTSWVSDNVNEGYGCNIVKYGT